MVSIISESPKSRVEAFEDKHDESLEDGNEHSSDDGNRNVEEVL